MKVTVPVIGLCKSLHTKNKVLPEILVLQKITDIAPPMLKPLVYGYMKYNKIPLVRYGNYTIKKNGYNLVMLSIIINEDKRIMSMNGTVICEIDFRKYKSACFVKLDVSSIEVALFPKNKISLNSPYDLFFDVYEDVDYSFMSDEEKLYLEEANM